MSAAPEVSKASPRIRELVERFREIGDTAMRDIPLYNAKLQVEAVGFRAMNDQWVGILITPWFMSLLRLPVQSVAFDMTRMGHKVAAALPCGERELMEGGDEVIGAYQSLSLHSPMFAFNSPDEARKEAEQQLQELMEEAEAPAAEKDGRLRAEPVKISRRAFLRGARSEA